MNFHITDLEERVARDLTSLAFAKAADSFSKFANKPFTIHSASLHISQDPVSLSEKKVEGLDNVLISAIVGEIRGESYLIFTPQQARALVEECLPPEMAKKEEMAKAILLEVDNILTASMVTQFSDFLSVRCMVMSPPCVS